MTETTATANFPLSIILLIFGIVICVIIYFIVLIIKVLKKYLRSRDTRREKVEIKKTLGETIKMYRTNCKMTQEFVAESLGVSRQAVSKWENGISDPSTSNLLALAKLFGVSAEEMLDCIK